MRRIVGRVFRVFRLVSQVPEEILDSQARCLRKAEMLLHGPRSYERNKDAMLGGGQCY